MRTIFISSFHQLISRNILSTPILDGLLGRADVQVVLLVPINKRLFFEDTYKRKNLIIESIAKDGTWRDALLRYLALAALDTRSLAIKRRTELGGSGRYLSRCIANRPSTRRLIRRLDRWLAPRGRFAMVLDHYAPDAIFSTDVQNENDVRLMHEARDRGIPVVGMVRSWDNLTAKGIMRFLPDTLVVANELVKAEAVRYSGMPRERIEVVGIPHYDFYIGEPRAGREEFFRRIGADPSKRLVLFAPTGERYLSRNAADREVLEILHDALPEDCHILVRFPPHDTVNLEWLREGGRISFDRPTIPHTVNPRKVELTREMDRHLADTLYHSALVVCGPSTMSIDAAVFGKPVVLVGFDGRTERPYLSSVRRYFDYEHQQPILKSGGARLAKSKEEFLAAVKAYLADPALDADRRKGMLEEQCAVLDGRSSRRVLNVLMGALDQEKTPGRGGAAAGLPAVRIKDFLIVPGRGLKTMALDESVVLARRSRCPADGSALEAVVTLVGHQGRQRLAIGCCRSCGFVGFVDLPSRQWYENFYHDVWDEGRHSGLETEAAERQRRPPPDLDRKKAAQALKLLAGIAPDRGRYVCEIGTGYGYPLSAIREAGFPKVIGVEHSRHRAAAGSRAYQLPILAGAFESREVQERLGALAPIAVFYSHHVLEHTYDPGEILALASGLQREGDYFVISLPNFLGEPSLVTLFFLPEPNTFTAAALERLMNRNGYEVVDASQSNTYELNVVAKKVAQPRPRLSEQVDYFARASDKFARALGLRQDSRTNHALAGAFGLRRGQRSSYRTRFWGGLHWGFQSRILGRVKRPVGIVRERSQTRFTAAAESPLEIQFDGDIRMLYL